MTRVYLAGGDAESRALLRGLLRMHHHEVMPDADSPDTLPEKSAAATPGVILVDGAAHGWADIATRAGARWPSAKVVLVAPPKGIERETSAPASAPSSVLPRPFRVEEFLRAVNVPADRSGAYAPGSSKPSSA
jgi:DNA-binding NarL/FixJ family response regulator